MMSITNNRRSLTFYQPTFVKSKTNSESYFSSGIASSSIGRISCVTTTTTNQFNNELNGFLTRLNTLRANDANRLNLSLPNQNARNRGVSRAWEYEKADVTMGGKGSANWNANERQQILNRGTVRGSEGHHQQNVSDHPEQQANPDNIKFYKSREEHFMEGHNGNWNNESNAPIIDKNKMLKCTNKKRVIKNEMRGLGIAVGIGLGIGFTIGFVVSLAQSGVSPESIKLSFIEGAKSGIESGVMSGVGYGIGRAIGEFVTQAMVGLLNNVGVNITKKIAEMCNIGAVGTLTIVVFSTYQFIKLKHSGMATREALFIVGKQTLFSLTLLAVSIASMGILGGQAGIIVSVSIGIIVITYSVANELHKKTFAEKIRIYMINKCKPVY